MAVTMGTDRWHDEELLDAAKVSPLAGLAESLGYEMNQWLEVATTALPETLRITSNRNDRDWTIQQIANLGATPLSWLGSDNAYQMPFERGKASDKKSKHMMTILHDFHISVSAQLRTFIGAKVLNMRIRIRHLPFSRTGK